MAACEYEEVRHRNLEDNRIMLEKLMVDLKNQMQVPEKVKGIKKSRDHKTRSIDVADFEPRRNPSRNGRFDPLNYSPPKTRGRRGSLSSTASSSFSSDSDSGNQLRVRFGFFNKGRNQESAEDDENSDEEHNLPKRQHRVHTHRDCRSADEITDEDLSRVAIFVSDKRYDSFYGSTCHQCRQKTDDMKTICRKGHCYGVRGQFCGPCLRNRYGEDAQAALKDPDWICPPCRGICNCSFCRKRAGKMSTGILIHLARESGFSDVNAFLQNKKSNSEIPRKREKKVKPKWGVKFGQKDSESEESTNKTSEEEGNVDNFQYENMLKDLTDTFGSPDKSQMTEPQSPESTEITSIKSPENLISPIDSTAEKKISAFKSVFQEKVLNIKRQPKPKVLDYEEIVPQKVQIKSPKARPSVEYTKDVEWSVGDLLWGKVSGHPWWPCRVALEPQTGLYTKMKGKSRQYHMHFFGETNETGWVYGSSVMKFEGKEAFDEHVTEVLQVARRSDIPKLEKSFKVPPGKMVEWNVAITEAESSLKLSGQDLQTGQRKTKKSAEVEKPDLEDLAEKEKSKPVDESEMTKIKTPEKSENLESTQDHIKVDIKSPEKIVVEWSVGDCLWAKLSGHPWWPCLVAADPELGSHVKMQGKSRMYHMHYFGDTCERGWVYGSSVMEFKGKAAFDTHVKDVFQSAKKSEKSKLEKMYKAYPGRMEALNIATLEAESALQLAQSARVEKHGYSAQGITPRSAGSSSKAKKRVSLPGKEKTKVSKRKLSDEVSSKDEPKRKRAKIAEEEIQTGVDVEQAEKI